MSPTPRTVSLRNEFVRKSLHLAMTGIAVWIYYVDQPLMGIGLIIATIFSVLIDLWRLNNNRINRYIRRFYRHLLRRHEQDMFLGSSHYMIAGLLSAYLFDREVAAASMAYLCLGDPAATFVGAKLGRVRMGTKSLEGSAAFFAVAAVIGLVVFPGRRDLVLIGAVVGAVAEWLPVPMDDNFRIPLMSGLVLSLFR
jgi:dolichol kinase